MRKFSWTAVTVGLLAAACARPPATAPGGDALTEWLITSETARAIGDAALNQSWLSSAPGDVADLRAVMAATQIADVAELDKTLRPVRDDMKSLLGALRQRRPGSTRGDLAHWVGVAVLTFSEAEPDTKQIPASDLWADDYLEDILELRGIALRGNLESVARPMVMNAKPPPPDFTFKPRSWNTLFAARAEQVGWPVFAAPASRAVIGFLQLELDETLEADDYLLAVQSPGRARVRVDYVETVGYYELNDERELVVESVGNLALRADQTITVLAWRAERKRLWVWLGDGRLAVVNSECCYAPENLDTLLWLRLSDGPSRGSWTMIPEEDFRAVPWEEYQAAQIAAGRWTAPSSSRPTSYPRLGEFSTGRTDRPVVAGAGLMVFRAGVAEGEPIFVVHGSPGLGSAYLREPVTAAIGAAHQLFFYDQRGSGYSDGADDRGAFTMRRMVDDLELLRKRADLEQIDLMGHSFGGLIALHYALVYPERVPRLLLVEPDPPSRV